MARDNSSTQTVSLSLAANLVAQVVDRRDTIPILSNVLLSSDGKNMVVTGTDLDIEVSAAAPSKLPAFSTTVDADLFSKIAATYSIDDALHLDGKKLIAGKGPTFTLETLPADDYHHIASIEPTAAFDLPAQQFLADLEALAPAISKEETRYYLNGICFHATDGKLRLISTDGHRMHMIERDAPEGLALAQSILPRKCVKLLRAVLEALPIATIKLSFGGLRVRFEIGPITINSKLIDGTYPDYTRLFPTETKGALIGSAAELLVSLNAAALILNTRSTAISFDFKAGIARAKEHGSAEMTAALPGEQAGELPETIGFNARYLKDICKRFGSSEMTMAVNDAVSPVLFTGADSALTAILMPVRL